MLVFGTSKRLCRCDLGTGMQPLWEVADDQYQVGRMHSMPNFDDGLVALLQGQQMTTLDQQALYAAIVTNPDEDPPRLMLADHLESLGDVRVPCPGCKGSKRDDWGRGSGFGKCPRCDGAGTILDTSNRDRAEYIRLQCGIRQHDEQTRLGVYKRENELLTRYRAEWLRAGTCGDCDGIGKDFIIATPSCLHEPKPHIRGTCNRCHGTGDAGGLLRKFLYPTVVDGVNVPGFEKTVAVEFRKGFPHRIEVPRLADCVVDTTQHIDVQNGRTWQPTPWLCAIVKYHPVSEVVSLDREPRNPPGLNDLYYWLRDCPNFPEPSAATLPSVIFYGLPGVNAKTIAMPFATRDLAITAAARVVAQFARNHNQRPI